LEKRVSTGSTKSRNRKGRGGARNNAPAPASAQPYETSAPEILPQISPRVWWIASLSILAVAAFVRLYDLDLKPLHHDEGVNGFFLTNLYREGVYHYDPTNYHGPTLYYLALAITKLKAFLFGESGLSTIAVRLVPALFGIATVWLALCLRRYIGTIGALTAAALIALSPGNVYISRYFIHEAQFVFFTLGIVVAALRYRETADSVYLMLASISAAFLFATKETAFISVAVLGLAWAVTVLYLRLFKRSGRVPWEKKRAKERKARTRRNQQSKLADTLERFGGITIVALMAGLALLLFIFINILFYSSFFTYWKGVGGAIESLQVWAKTGTKDHAANGWHAYLWWLVQEEAPLLILGVAGALFALIRRRNRFGIFAGAWAFGILAAYTLIPYKTPWLMLNFTVPLAIIAGYGVNEIYDWGKEPLARVVALIVAVAALTVCATQTVILNFRQYDNDRYPYVYAHTSREFIPMVNEIEQLAERAGTGQQTGITITAPEYWPLPWYLRDYPKAGFFGRMTPTQEPIVVGSLDQEEKLDAMLGDRYVRLNSYPLRPGVTLLLYVKKELIRTLN
jgi:uncharacterized protein (TIGR03663 family)